MNNLAETRSLYLELLSGYKTASAKKAFLSREMKALRSVIEDIREAVETPGHSKGWYLGDKYSMSHVENREREMDILQDLYSSL